MNHSLIEIEPLNIKFHKMVAVYDAESVVKILNQVLNKKIHSHPIRFIKDFGNKVCAIAPAFNTRRNKFIAECPECKICGSKVKYIGIQLCRESASGSFVDHFSNNLSIEPKHSVLAWSAENKRKLTLDHIVPRSLGGINSYKNYQVLCEKCNSETKGNQITKQDYEIYRERGLSMVNIDKNKILELIQ